MLRSHEIGTLIDVEERAGVVGGAKQDLISETCEESSRTSVTVKLHNSAQQLTSKQNGVAPTTVVHWNSGRRTRKQAIR